MAGRARFGEVFTDPASDPIPVGLRCGDLVHAVRINGADAAGGVVPDGLDDQLGNAFAAMRRSVEAAGGATGNIAQVSLFLSDAREAMPSVNARWVEMFPDAEDRPTYKFMSTALPGNQRVALEYFAVLGAARRVVNIEGVAHTNPIPMAVRIGDYLFSSRVLPMEPATGEYPAAFAAQTDALFGNLDAVLREGGMAWADVAQGRLFLADMANLKMIEARWAEQFQGAAPPLHPIRYAVAPTLLVMIELIAARS